nr:MAG TPA: hypothetical protein [Caudoviricetes sp.]
MTSFLQKNKFLLSFFIFCPQFVPIFLIEHVLFCFNIEH